jgi:chaperonin GroES
MGIAAEIAAMGYRFPGDRIFIVRDGAADKSTGGIILPDSAKKKPIRGTVVALGAGLQLEDDEFKSDAAVRLGELSVLDVAIFTKYNPVLIELADSKGEMMILEVMHPNDIYVIL